MIEAEQQELRRQNHELQQKVRRYKSKNTDLKSRESEYDTAFSKVVGYVRDERGAQVGIVVDISQRKHQPQEAPYESWIPDTKDRQHRKAYTLQ